MSNAIAWVLSISAICACITACVNAFFSAERKMVKLKHDQKAQEVDKFMMLTEEQAKALQKNTCSRKTKCPYPSVCSVGGGRSR